MRKKNEYGFSLIELTVVLAVMALLALQAIPALLDMQLGIDQASARDILEYDISRTKSEAVSSGARAILKMNTDGSGYTVGVDRAPVANPPTIEETLFTRTLPNDVFLNVAMDVTIMFDSRGLVVDEFGEPTSIEATLQQKGDDFSPVFIYPVGRVCFGDNCAQI